VPKPTALIVAALLCSVGGARAQDASSLLSTDVDLGDFGVTDPSAVVYGRVSIVDDPAGKRLDVRFLRTSPPEAPESVPQAVTLEEPPPDVPPRAAHNGLWVWNTSELLADEALRARFLNFVTDEGIDRVFLYLPAAAGQKPAAGLVPFDGSAVGPLVQALRERGALTYALDGDPDYVRPENRQGVLATVRRVAAFNRGAPPERRFAGVHYDIEPYLTGGFQGVGRGEILRDYIDLLADLSDAAHSGGLTLGVDIPFWLDELDEATGQPFEVEIDGVGKPVLDQVLSHVDDVAVMAYRTAADGPNGVVAQASREVVRAGQKGVGVYVGLETTPVADEELHTFHGSMRIGLPSLTDAPWVVIEPLGAGRARVWYVIGQEGLEALSEATADAPAPLMFWYAGAAVPLPGTALSFASLGAQELRTVADTVRLQFSGEASFRGVAFHDYEGLRALLAR
jgi:hypothetical protein